MMKHFLLLLFLLSGSMLFSQETILPQLLTKRARLEKELIQLRQTAIDKDPELQALQKNILKTNAELAEKMGNVPPSTMTELIKSDPNYKESARRIMEWNRILSGKLDTIPAIRKMNDELLALDQQITNAKKANRKKR